MSSSIPHGMPPKTTIRTNKHFKKEDLPASSIAVTKLCSLARPHCVPRMLMVSPSSICQDSNQKKINTMSTECLICSPFRLPIIHILYILTSTICWKALHSLYTIRRSRMNNISYGQDVPWRNKNLLQDRYMYRKNGFQVLNLISTTYLMPNTTEYILKFL